MTQLKSFNGEWKKCTITCLWNGICLNGSGCSVDNYHIVINNSIIHTEMNSEEAGNTISRAWRYQSANKSSKPSLYASLTYNSLLPFIHSLTQQMDRMILLSADISFIFCTEWTICFKSLYYCCQERTFSEVNSKLMNRRRCHKREIWDILPNIHN